MSDAVDRLNAALEGRYAIERELGEGAYDVQEVGRISSHLLDLLLRIVARRLSSQAKYASAVFPVGLLRDIDWVNATTSATQLVPP